MQTGEGNHVDSKLPEVSVQLAGEPEASGDTGHGEGHQVVEVTISRSCKLQSPAQEVYCRFTRFFLQM